MSLISTIQSGSTSAMMVNPLSGATDKLKKLGDALVLFGGGMSGPLAIAISDEVNTKSSASLANLKNNLPLLEAELRLEKQLSLLSGIPVPADGTPIFKQGTRLFREFNALADSIFTRVTTELGSLSNTLAPFAGNNLIDKLSNAAKDPSIIDGTDPRLSTITSAVSFSAPNLALIFEDLEIEANVMINGEASALSQAMAKMQAMSFLQFALGPGKSGPSTDLMASVTSVPQSMKDEFAALQAAIRAQNH